MSGFRHWKILLCLLAIFVAGGVVGAVITQKMGSPKAKRMDPADWGRTSLKRMTHHLHLSSNQVQRLRPVLQERAKDLTAIRTETRLQTAALLKKVDEQIIELLAPKQIEKYSQLKQDYRKKTQNKSPHTSDRPPPAAPSKDKGPKC